MSKVSIADAATKLGVSKEAIHNRIRRGSLECIVENGVKLVILKPTSRTAKKPTLRRTNTKVVTEPDTRYYKLLEEQNQKLQLKVEKLEDETKDLREQKEEMIISERVRIEHIYKDKDEQLKNILSAISSKFLLNTPINEVIVEEVTIEEELVEAEVDTQTTKKPTSLKNYLKHSDFSKKKKEKIEKRFNKIAKKDSRIVKVGKKLYIDLAKYDYSELFR